MDNFFNDNQVYSRIAKSDTVSGIGQSVSLLFIHYQSINFLAQLLRFVI